MIKVIIRALLNLIMLIAMFSSITYVFYLLIIGIFNSFNLNIMKEFSLILALFIASLIFYKKEEVKE